MKQPNKIVCYTCITGNYDQLRVPSVPQSSDVDFVCFTDDSRLQSDFWSLKPIPDDLSLLSNVKQQRVIKICPHRYLRNYQYSIWVDGNLEIIGNIRRLVDEYDLSKFDLFVRLHPKRNCIYDEAEEVVRQKKDLTQKVPIQISKYKSEEYPAHIGMVESNVLLRNHMTTQCQIFDNYWAAELLRYSHRDQLSFNYICWKLNFKYGIMTKQASIKQNSYFRFHYHG